MSFLRSFIRHKIRANARHYQIHLFYACTSVWNEPLRFLLDSNIVINRFRSDSSLPPGDSHLLDVGLTSPTCRFPPDLFLCLGFRKRESISMLSPRDGQALGQGLKENRSLQKLGLIDNSIGDVGAQAPV